MDSVPAPALKEPRWERELAITLMACTLFNADVTFIDVAASVVIELAKKLIPPLTVWFEPVNEMDPPAAAWNVVLGEVMEPVPLIARFEVEVTLSELVALTVPELLML